MVSGQALKVGLAPFLADGWVLGDQSLWRGVQVWQSPWFVRGPCAHPDQGSPGLSPGTSPGVRGCCPVPGGVGPLSSWSPPRPPGWAQGLLCHSCHRLQPRPCPAHRSKHSLLCMSGGLSQEPWGAQLDQGSERSPHQGVLGASPA